MRLRPPFPRPAGRRRCARPRPACTPRVEPLESRTCPSFLAPTGQTVYGDGPVRAVGVGYLNGSGLEGVLYTTTQLVQTPAGPVAQGYVGTMFGYGNGFIAQGGLTPVNGEPGRGAMVVGDFNHDGLSDVATTVQVGPYGSAAGKGELAILLGAGVGSFLPPVYIDLGDIRDDALLGADLNGDGSTDLLVGGVGANGVGRVTELLATGTGAFVPAAAYPVVDAGTAPVRQPTALALADLAGDGTADDLVVADQALGGAGGEVHVFHNTAGVQVPAETVPLAFASQPTGVAAADFTGDGHVDLVVSDLQLTQFHLLTNRGDGTFPAPARLDIGSSQAAVMTMDFNADGKPDLLLSIYDGSNTLALLQGNGNGTFRKTERMGGGQLALGDLNGDGHADLIAGDNWGPVVWVHLGDSQNPPAPSGSSGAAAAAASSPTAAVSGAPAVAAAGSATGVAAGSGVSTAAIGPTALIVPTAAPPHLAPLPALAVDTVFAGALPWDATGLSDPLLATPAH